MISVNKNGKSLIVLASNNDIKEMTIYRNEVKYLLSNTMLYEVLVDIIVEYYSMDFTWISKFIGNINFIN